MFLKKTAGFCDQQEDTEKENTNYIGTVSSLFLCRKKRNQCFCRQMDVLQRRVNVSQGFWCAQRVRNLARRLHWWDFESEFLIHLKNLPSEWFSTCQNMTTVSRDHSRKLLQACRIRRPQCGGCTDGTFIRTGQCFLTKRGAKDASQGFSPLLTGSGEGLAEHHSTLTLSRGRWRMSSVVPCTSRKPHSVFKLLQQTVKHLIWQMFFEGGLPFPNSFYGLFPRRICEWYLIDLSHYCVHVSIPCQIMCTPAFVQANGKRF